jgi:hypothetical protein
VLSRVVSKKQRGRRLLTLIASAALISGSDTAVAPES